MGAVCAFATAHMTGSPYLGILAGIASGAVFSLLFGFLTLTLVTNQVATGLALTILGLGVSGMLGEGLPRRSPKRERFSRIWCLFNWKRPCIGHVLPSYSLAGLLKLRSGAREVSRHRSN